LASSVPIFIGGMARWLVDKISRKTSAESEMSPGVLLSSGYIAGGAIAGILAAFLALSPWLTETLDLREKLGPTLAGWIESDWLPLIPFGVLVLLLVLVGTEVILRGKRTTKRSATGAEE
jgi:hypothetical protein